MNIQPHEIIGALAALGVYPPAKVLVKRATLSNDITGLSGSTPMTIPWDTGDFDPLNPTRIYVPPGFSHVLITGMARVSGTGNAGIQAWLNGDMSRDLGYNLGSVSSPTAVSMCAQVLPVSSGDYFELAVRRTTSLTDILSYGSNTMLSLTLFH